METSVITKESKLPFLTRSCRQLLFNAMSDVEYGTLTITDSDGEHCFAGKKDSTNLHADIEVLDTNTYKAMVLGGSIGAAEAYMSRDWTSNNLTNVIRFMSLNLNSLNKMESGLTRLSKPIQMFYHLANKNTEKGSRRNIAAHYDLGNDLFKLFLDPTMMYSSAIYPNNDATLEEASKYKLDRICRKLNLSKNDHVVEIGTGWGGFAIHAAKYYGCRVTTTTLSKQQYEYAKQQVKVEKLEDKIELLTEDYRNVKGKYDKLVSIEMIEAVGHQYYKDYFKALGNLLKPTGIALLQAISIDHPRYKTAIRDVDFIQRYIFPGSCIPSINSLIDASSDASDLKLVHHEDITPHYAKTLGAWHKNFFQRADEIRSLGYNEEFMRMWDYYFCYCEGGFQERVIDCSQLVFAKPLHREKSILGNL